MRTPEFITIMLESGVSWEQIKEIGWRAGGIMVYIPKFSEKIERNKKILREYERENKLHGKNRAIEYLAKRKNLSQKTIKRIVALKDDLYLFE